MSSTGDSTHQWPALACAPRQIGFPLLRRSGDDGAVRSAATAAPEREPSAAEQQALAIATEAGHAAGLESGRAAASAEAAERLQALEEQVDQVRNQLQEWSAALELAFTERCHQALAVIMGERLKTSETFFSELLREAAADLHSDIDSLQLVVASDVVEAVPGTFNALVDAELEAGEIRIVSDARVAQLHMTELIAAALQNLPQLDAVAGAQATETDIDAD